MEMPELGRKHLAFVAAVIILLFVVTPILQITVYGVDGVYGDIRIYEERTDAEMDESSTLDVQDGDFITAWLAYNAAYSHKPTDEAFTANLYQEGVANPIAIGVEKDIPGTGDQMIYSRKWEITLEQCPQGTFSYFIKYFAVIQQGSVLARENSFTFQITNSEEAVFGDAEITVKPDDASYSVDESAIITWEFSYNGSCVGTLTLDGTEVDSQEYEASNVDQLYSHIVNTSVAGTYELIFTLTPYATANPSVSDTVEVTVTGAATDTTTTDTTPTTTLPYTPAPLPTIVDEALIPVELQWIALAAVLIGIYFLEKRRREQ